MTPAPIGGIAAQTNLLALNAAIEAARAGEVIIEIQDGAKQVVGAVGRFANQLK